MSNPILPNSKVRSSNFDEYSKEEMETLAKLYSQSFEDVKEGEIIKGKIVSIQGDSIILDVDFASRCTIPRSEFGADMMLKPGMEIEAMIESFEDQEGNLVLSKKRADFLRIWNKILNAYETGEIIQGKILKRIKGGMVVDLMGIEAFLPGSQIDIRPVRDFDAFVGQTMDFKVVKVNVPTENVVVSHKQLVEDRQQTALLEKYPVGSKHTGIARNLTNFGVFVELEPGVDGLVHISDLSWTKKILHPGEVVKKDEKIDVIVLSVDTNQRKISLGHKQVQDNPWDTFEQNYSVGTITEGKIVKVLEKGLIAELPAKVDGFVPATQLSTAKLKNISYYFPVDTSLPLKVVEFDKDNKKIVLSALGALKEKSNDEIAEYINNHKLEEITVNDIKNTNSDLSDRSDIQNKGYVSKDETIPAASFSETKETGASVKTIISEPESSTGNEDGYW